MITKRNWIVLGPYKGSPTGVHYRKTRIDAIEESERLANLNKGCMFSVYELIGTSLKTDAAYREIPKDK